MRNESCPFITNAHENSAELLLLTPLEVSRGDMFSLVIGRLTAVTPSLRSQLQSARHSVAGVAADPELNFLCVGRLKWGPARCSLQLFSAEPSKGGYRAFRRWCPDPRGQSQRRCWTKRFVRLRQGNSRERACASAGTGDLPFSWEDDASQPAATVILRLSIRDMLSSERTLRGVGAGGLHRCRQDRGAV